MTRGHYRSCGKDPHACCVSHLLGDEPLIRSGFQQTYASDKDTGRYWDAGASNVHWVIATDDQVERGIGLALERTKAPGVLIEGNSFLRFIDVDFAVLVTGNYPAKSNAKIKASTRWALQKASALYVFGESALNFHPEEILTRFRHRFGPQSHEQSLPIHSANDLSKLVEHVSRVHCARAGDNQGS